MSVAEPQPEAQASAPAAQPYRRPLRKRAMHLARRAHLYFGLFLFPWAVLYGVTAFLFNHPTAFSDAPSVSFGASALKGTPLEVLPSPNEQAEQVVKALNEKQKPATPYARAGEAKYAREFAFATAKGDGFTVNVLFDVKNGGGTVRTTPVREKKEPERAPFATGSAPEPKRGGAPKAPRESRDGIKLPDPLHERVKAAVPSVLERTGFAAGEVAVTSVPDITFPIEADGRVWTASYNALTGSVTGAPEGAKPESELSARRFLTRLHLAHGYPGEANGKWFWALVVDAMAFTMCFWGVTGLVMWWQIKATRWPGLLVLALSAACATALALEMHAALTGG
jgi:hypothetical protein